MVAIPDTTDSQTNLLGPMPEGVWAVLFCQHDDALGRPMSRNADAFGYNERGEVVFSHGGTGNTEEAYAYDGIGNHVLAASGGVTNAYTANALNQYASILSASAPPCATIPQYDADGNLLSDGTLDFTYDAANRLVPVSSNGVPVLANFYDANSRRVKKVTPEYAATFFYDDWNLVEERIVHANGTTSTIHYYWGKDLSGTWQGAGGIGGLLYVTVNGIIYIPCHDNNGNVTRYLDADGNTVAQYAYDAFGNITSTSGTLADFFRHRFSTKYFDGETSFYYYGYRFYRPDLMRWLNRDPIEEEGGLNLYAFVANAVSYKTDIFGLSSYNLYTLMHNQLCETAYRKIGGYLNTAQEKAAWNRYTNHGWRGRNRDIELSAAEVKQIAESINGVLHYVGSRRSSCKKGVSDSSSTSIGGNAPNPWRLALGGVSVRVSTECSNGCFAYAYEINDLYDFDIKGIPGTTNRSFWGEVATIGVNFTEACLKCGWQTFYHKGIYHGK